MDGGKTKAAEAECTSSSVMVTGKSRREALSTLEGGATGLRASALEPGLLSLNLSSATHQLCGFGKMS